MAMPTGKVIAALIALAAGGCGGSDGGPPTPTVHTLVPGDQSTARMGESVTYGPFTLPEDALLSYAIEDQPIGGADDTLESYVASHASVVSGSPTIHGGRLTGPGSTTATTPALPADDYDVVIVCRNAGGSCRFSVTVTATY